MTPEERDRASEIITGIFRIWIALSVIVWLILTIYGTAYDGKTDAEELVLHTIYFAVFTAITICVGYPIIWLIVYTIYWIKDGFKGE